MRASSVFSSLFTFFLPPAIITTLILYFYPVVYGCSFAYAKPAVVGCMIPGQEVEGVDATPAPFRLLALADPQLEGDTSLPDPNGALFPSFGRLWTNVREEGVTSLPYQLVATARDVVFEDFLGIAQGYRKRLDLWGNDRYLAHIYRSISWWTDPTHTVVLGDLLGSQHISDTEFRRRSRRFWTSVFKGAKRVPRTVTDVTGRSEVLGQDPSWKDRIIAVAGNHDIGYSGDITKQRVERFEEMYGSVNWDIRFTIENETSESTASSAFSSFRSPSSPPELRLVILNSMNLDSPAKDMDLQQQSRDFASHALHEQPNTHPYNTATVLLTHIPLHKEDGVCVDRNFIDWMPEHQGGGIKEQNHLSDTSSLRILDGLTKSGHAIILNGHDHEGCDTVFYRTKEEYIQEDTDDKWSTTPYYRSYEQLSDFRLRTIREITVRSMMGSYGGNAVLLSGWFDDDAQEWRFESTNCTLGVQHLWWAVHIFDLVVISFGVLGIATAIWEVKCEEAMMNGNSKTKRE